MERSNRTVIVASPPDRVEKALARVLADLPPQDRAATVGVFLNEANRGRLPLDGLLEARRRGRLVGAVFSVVELGRTAVVWPPRLASREPMATAAALLAATCERLERESVVAAHAILPAVGERDDRVLRGAGFEPLVQLFYLACRRDAFPDSEPDGALKFEPYRSANHGRLAKVIEATYVHSLDCPAMEGVRRVEDVLEGYRATGEFAPERWRIVRHAGQDVGCLLLADHPQQQNLELVYMGVVPASRGSGWGAQIARHAQWVAATMGRDRLVLAVDAENGPALRAYAAVGFEAWDRRQVYFKRLVSTA
jgi:GNAT superfamily N-acetyltransferase